MLFKITHIDPAGHRHKACVTGANATDAMEQMDREFGESRGGACVRMAARPSPRLVVRSNGSRREAFRGVPCGS